MKAARNGMQGVMPCTCETHILHNRVLPSESFRLFHIRPGKGTVIGRPRRPSPAGKRTGKRAATRAPTSQQLVCARAWPCDWKGKWMDWRPGTTRRAEGRTGGWAGDRAGGLAVHIAPRRPGGRAGGHAGGQAGGRARPGGRMSLILDTWHVEQLPQCGFRCCGSAAVALLLWLHRCSSRPVLPCVVASMAWLPWCAPMVWLLWRGSCGVAPVV